uniref:Venom allergen/ancylostoma secreted protein-like 7 isoform 3 n=1 Tax=Heligmosomoides polygyrus bakeri TaxID=375939 RepID=G4XWX6_HELBE|nr:venom allergen/ancylostoma secreted protein-like 7 isoform 3 [Heligmosomoides bakeri]
MAHLVFASLVIAQVFYAAARVVNLNQLCPYNEAYTSYTDWTRTVFMDTHNDYRSQLAMGQQKNGPKRMAQYARNMNQMYYICDIEKEALKSAKECSETPTVPPEYKANAMLVPMDATITHDDDAAKKAMEAWWEEFDNYGLNKMLFSQEAEDAGKVVHATKMAWALNNRLGCATHKCGDKYSVVCFYPKMVNTVGKYVYSKGPNESDICTKCPSGTTCIEEIGLCDVDDLGSLFP